MFDWLKVEEAGVKLDDCAVTFTSRMDLFIKAVLVQNGLRGISEALEGVSGGSQPHNLTGGECDEANP